MFLVIDLITISLNIQSFPGYFTAMMQNLISRTHSFLEISRSQLEQSTSIDWENWKISTKFNQKIKQMQILLTCTQPTIPPLAMFATSWSEKSHSLLWDYKTEYLIHLTEYSDVLKVHIIVRWIAQLISNNLFLSFILISLIF